MDHKLQDISGSNLSLTIGILSFNEEAFVTDTFNEVLEAFIDYPYHYEIILFDDGSTDGTRRISDQLSDPNATTRSLFHSTNRGIGAGVRTVTGESACSHILLIPGDNSYGADSLRAVASKIAEADVIVGKRGVGGVRRWRRILSLSVSLSTRIWTHRGGFDAGGLNVFRTELLRSCASMEDSYISVTETCMRISMLQPSTLVVPVMQKSGSNVRSNSVKLAEVATLLRVHRRMAAVKLLRRKHATWRPLAEADHLASGSVGFSLDAHIRNRGLNSKANQIGTTASLKTSYKP